MEMKTLAQERSKAEFDVEAMKVVWAGGEASLRLNQRMAELVANDPEFQKDSRVMQTRSELLKDTFRKAAHAWELINKLHFTEEEARCLRKHIDQPSYADLHWGVFIPAIKGQATDAQQKKWLPLAYSQAIIGCYAQTELGHGSNVQRLETTATFEPSTDGFIVNTPTIAATKWWPGGLGKVSTHAIVHARLLTNGKDYGIHAFIVQIRSLEDHQPLPGITVADIGTKFGSRAYNSVDNGLLRFNNVHIPRENMLMRLATVTKEGKYVHSNVPTQLAYGAMVNVRKSIVMDASYSLARAVTIAVRYSAVRRQFGVQDGQPEMQSRLFPLLATAYAYRFLGQWMSSLYSDTMACFENNDFSTLPEVHACTAGLKSIATSTTADGIEECRKLCGGHGYLTSSGLPDLFAVYVPSCTYEGDNVILLLQVARYLMKTLKFLGSGKEPSGTAAYLSNVTELVSKNCEVAKESDWISPKTLRYAFEARSARLALKCATQIAAASTQDEGFSEASCELLGASRAHCELIIVTRFMGALEREIPGRGVKNQLQILCNIYALSLVTTRAGDFLMTGYLSPEQVELAKSQLRDLFKKVRHNAVSLVDAFDYTDFYLGSSLGRYDGNVYESLYNEALKDPTNASAVTEGYTEFIRPILKQQLGTSMSRL
ncbi:hypothetical protein KP509_08G071700 [Ceratopteris richardii]|uniref:Acyl-coenzyme A oxidase n=1 Tax=Ceratopteris richardii TaxID=49495 RepID=A0A8T2U6R5_CERRI|nr:hypothetical protein KP509_08G071700 [Ceratopteris richardii]